MPSSSYGSYSPNAIDPFSIESTLAGIVGQNNPAAASQALDLYQIKNTTSQSDYNQQAAQQQEFAKHQLAQQLYEKNLAALGEAGKTPGLLDIYASSPQYSGVLGGADPGVLSRVSTNLAADQNASIAQKGGSAINSLDMAGKIVSDADATNLARVPVTTGVSRQERVAAINAAGHAASGDSGMPGVTMQVEGPYGKESLAYGKKVTEAQRHADLDRRGVPRTYAEGGQPAGQGTGLPNNPAAPTPPGPQKQQTTRPNNESPGVRKAQEAVLANIENHKGTPEYKNVKAGMAKNNGRPLIQVDKQGKPHVVGGDGTVY